MFPKKLRVKELAHGRPASTVGNSKAWAEPVGTTPQHQERPPSAPRGARLFTPGVLPHRAARADLARTFGGSHGTPPSAQAIGKSRLGKNTYPLTGVSPFPKSWWTLQHESNFYPNLSPALTTRPFKKRDEFHRKTH